MATQAVGNGHKILILATLSGGYRGADAVGQAQLAYAPNTYIVPVLSAAVFPETFYLDAFDRGFDGILVMYSGTDCPYEGAAERTAQIVNRTYERMKERGLDPRRLRLTAICTVCVRPFLEEVQKMNQTLDALDPIAGAVPDASPQTL